MKPATKIDFGIITTKYPCSKLPLHIGNRLQIATAFLIKSLYICMIYYKYPVA